MKSFFTSILLFFCAALMAQSGSPRLLCGQDIFTAAMRKHYPQYQQAIERTFQQASQDARKLQQRGKHKVNVVVHIVWNQPEENLDDSIILDQMRILNEDYNQLNPDQAKLRERYQEVAGNVGIEFNLAAIERVQTDVLFEVDLFGGTEGLLSTLKHSAEGGSDAWPTEHYLNIWVCRIQPLKFGSIEIGQILGFAFPPADLSNWPPDQGAPSPEQDGVAVDFRTFGSNNPNPLVVVGFPENPTIKGRTAVHEVGHYFGLRHIWGDGGAFGPNDCDQSDGVEDTPYANIQSATDCDTTKNTCSVVEDFYGEDMPDLVENYMDYASEECMVMFTKGQAALMNAVLEGPRVGLLEPNTSVKDLGSQPWALYPNPASEQVMLDLSLLQNTFQPTSLRILNLNGQEMLRQSIAGRQQLSIATDAYPAGMYLVEIRSASGSDTRKLVIRR